MQLAYCNQHAEVMSNAQEMGQLQVAGEVELCADLRTCGSLVCDYEALYSDADEPAEVQLEIGDSHDPDQRAN